MARTLSQKIDHLAHQCRGRKHLTVLELFHLMGPSEESLLIWIFSIPFVLCYQIPGFSIVVSALIVLQGVGMALHKKFWIPKFLRKKKISGDNFARFISHTIPFLKKLEKFAHPRGTIYQHHPLLVTFNGWLMAMAGVLLVFHIGTKIIPSLGLIMLSVSLLEEDILWMLCAYFILLVHGAHMLMILAHT